MILKIKVSRIKGDILYKKYFSFAIPTNSDPEKFSLVLSKELENKYNLTLEAEVVEDVIGSKTSISQIF